ncbi:cobaltochelatase subunit CobN [Candidatus Synechococcus calcipolaris G9]|uniref:Cobaltochelatase subunit CobN n=1 Tax=Candidatus Synechococcus calcipolaris G9 TaxID=1497997 RepID=A0ABT6F0M4_9SYNE|nr:cobaltochelatase subunit CobN [Candidatus Synechococcus calcipolaris]MDG2991333.1 cobaltochelatase subunit CobN [Candidatus Synechococcus calcipolaris G9]
MHRILSPATASLDDHPQSVVFIQQDPAPIICLTAADTDITLIAQALPHLPENFPDLRLAHLLRLQQQIVIDDYAEQVLAKAQVILIRLLGGRAYWPYGLEVVQEIVTNQRSQLIVLPGDDRPDLELMSLSTCSLKSVDILWQYFREGGVANIIEGLKFLAQIGCDRPDQIQPPRSIPRLGTYREPEIPALDQPQVGILFYRAHYLAANTQVIEELCRALEERGLVPRPLFVQSLQDPDIQTEVLQQWQGKIDLILNTTGFSLARFSQEQPQLGFWQALNVPVLQVILSSSSQSQWQGQWQGLTPRDLAMNVVLPEVDGRIITRAVSFKTLEQIHPQLETPISSYQTLGDRRDFVADLAKNWVNLGQKPPQERRIALILANYPCRDGRIANGVGLDTPASCIAILNALKAAGYHLGESKDIPVDGQALIERLTARITNDPESASLRPVDQQLSLADYQAYFEALPDEVKGQVLDRWPAPDRPIPISGFCLGNIFIGIQPSRGYDQDPSLNYHAPDLEPTPAYLGFYAWVRSHFRADALIHLGKHGNLEWLPGKSIALSQSCFPEVALGPLPHFYPFIVNDPGEGSQAKRRSQAVIIDHLTPPLTRAELYGPLEQLSHLIEEYYEAEQLDPPRLAPLRQRIDTLIRDIHLDQDLKHQGDRSWADWLTTTDGYLCELRDAQIRDGLHIFGQCPQGRQLRDLILAIARGQHSYDAGLIPALAQDQGFRDNPLHGDPSHPAPDSQYRTIGQWQAALEIQAQEIIDHLLGGNDGELEMGPASQRSLAWIQTQLLPALQQTHQEIDHLLRGLGGGYVPSGPAGAPSRGRPDVLPTGRNFYAVDLRSVPTETAWDIGRHAAERVIERYCQDEGEYPRSLGLSIWGTSTMRTGGDDLAQALALLGVQPVWDGPSRRVVDLDVIPLSLLGRPRVDVTLRISGFFRDAFPNLIELFDHAVHLVANLAEPPEQNPLAAQVAEETQTWQDAGLSQEQARERSHFRIFGSKPGAYGAGLQGLIEGQNWQDDQDLARAYINWSSYAYQGQGIGHTAPEAFQQRLGQIQIVLQNQDNREHDLLDSDDYYQFHGGLTAAVRSLQGRQPQIYFGDHSRPDQPRVRHLQEELARVYRSRVINPKWIAGVMGHGYKGAFEMAATVDYLFAYQATTRCVSEEMFNYMMSGIADAYVLDEAVQAFVRQHNPWALRDMAERLLEAHQRGMWQGDQNRLAALRSLILEAEGVIEQRG